VVAEARVERILAGEVMIQPQIRLAFLEVPHGNVAVVVDQRTRNVGRGVEISHLCGDGVDQAGRNLVAGRAGGLDSTRVGGLRIAAGIAEKWSANNVALDIGSGAVRVIQLGYAEERLGEVPG